MRFLVALFGLLGTGCFLAPGLSPGDAGGPMDAQLETDAGRSDGGAEVDSAVVDSGEPPADAVTPPAPDTGPPDTQDAGPAQDAGPPAVDAGPDAGSDAGTDAGPDAGPDAGTDAGPDAGRDAGSDAGLPSCDAEYGGTEGYSLCSQSADRCEFYFNPDGAARASCDDICGSTNCIATYDNSGTCGRWYESRCDARFRNAICVCDRPRL